jgi:SAM-dependent methyltransferase
MIFDQIYRAHSWNGAESASGPGSGSAATERVGAAIVDLAAEIGAQSVLDIGCGDGYWMPHLPGYLGIDVSAEAIKIARRRHPRRDYRAGELESVAGFDLVIVRDVIQHLPSSEALRILDTVRDCWLLASTFIGGTNVEIEAGGAYPPDLTAPPFDLPQPERLIFDGYGYAEGDPLYRDVRKFLGLWVR